MSDNIEILDGKGQYMGRQAAWHRLGEVTGEDFTWADLLAADISVTKRVDKVPLSDLVILCTVAGDDQFGIVREDNVLLATVGARYEPVQAVQAYEFGSDVRRQAEGEGLRADLISVGSLDHGRRYFFTYDLGRFTIGDYEVADYWTVSGSHDGTSPLLGLNSPILVVCANTLAAAKAAGTTHYRFRHTSGVHDRMDEARQALGTHHENREAYVAMAEGLMRTPVAPQTYKALLDTLFPAGDDVPTRTRNVNDAAREKVGLLYRAEDQTVDVVGGVEGTAWAFVQSVNTYENWGMPTRNTRGVGSDTLRAMRQADSVLSGKQPLTDKALDLVLA
jgi:phage/plasmid-like protein (TIGR03299 family)